MTALAQVDRAGVAAMLRGASLELSARDRASEATLRAALPAGTTIHINHAQADTHHGIIAAATRVRRAGFNPVPHIAARYLASYTQLNDYLARAVGEAGVDQAFVIAGDVDLPVGSFDSSLSILRTGLFQRHGIVRVGLGAYPEGHPKLAPRELDAALLDKLAYLRGAALQPFIVTQFSFEAAPIADWILRTRAAGVDAPIHVGLAGPASVASLAKFALRCGVRQSLRAVIGGHTAIARLLTEASPEPVIAALAADARVRHEIAALHIFTFGGFSRTAAWLNAATHPSP
jgi:methylenetetrahydrofolate reductase (NADPH)